MEDMYTTHIKYKISTWGDGLVELWVSLEKSKFTLRRFKKTEDGEYTLRQFDCELGVFDSDEYDVYTSSASFYFTSHKEAEQFLNEIMKEIKRQDTVLMEKSKKDVPLTDVYL